MSTSSRLTLSDGVCVWESYVKKKPQSLKAAAAARKQAATREEVISATIDGNCIQERLADLNMSKVEFAIRTGASYRHSNRIIVGASDPSLLLACKMADVLGVAVLELFDVNIQTRRVSRSKEMFVSA